ncbi:hypothetical protein B0A52_08668 [Exophiala mesophila]|uniref:CFEM domain-containing protein n=1 Tax=Exophiala mesophila TaxID=212818 RepID=A0A438MYZ9_EXOME|nr:hypothetical protein B0A52_08668 [Exophiala mesophila]
MLTQKLTVAAALLFGVAIVTGQDLNALPACARDPVSTAVTASGCPANDTNCVCSSTAFLNAIAVTIPAACSAEDIAIVISAGKILCPNLAGGSDGGSTTEPSDDNPPASTPTGNGGGDASTPPSQTDGQTATPTNGDQTTAAPGTVTSTTSVPETSPTTTTGSSDESSSTTSSTSTSESITTEPETTATETPSRTTSTTTYSTFTGAAANDKINGVFAMAVGVFGAVALL